MPHIFKELFEEDILEEEVIFEWAKKVKYSIDEENVTLILRIVQVSKKNVSKELAQKIHDKAAPFIKWLQEAEEETSESDGYSHPFPLFMCFSFNLVLIVKTR